MAGLPVYNRRQLAQNFRIWCTIIAVAAAAGSLAAAPLRGLTESSRLAAVYDTILQGHIDEARQALPRTCPPAPAETCLALSEVAVWWQLQQDPDNRGLDDALQRAATAAIDASERWTRREPERAEAWFYLAGAYAPLTEWRVLRGEKIAAARDGNRIRIALEKSVALDPELKDAYFGIGLYHYYADIAPAALKVLRFLLFLPGGDRALGLREMLTTREQGVLLRGEADYQLHYIYLWYEHQPQRALELLRGLESRYPSNGVFLDRISRIEREYLKDRHASRLSSQRLLDRALSGRLAFAPIHEAKARLALADDAIALGEPRQALTIVQPVIDRALTAPYGATATAHLLSGRAHLALREREAAIAALNRAVASAPNDDPEGIKARARQALSEVRAQAR